MSTQAYSLRFHASALRQLLESQLPTSAIHLSLSSMLHYWPSSIPRSWPLSSMLSYSSIGSPLYPATFVTQRIWRLQAKDEWHKDMDGAFLMWLFGGAFDWKFGANNQPLVRLILGHSAIRLLFMDSSFLTCMRFLLWGHSLFFICGQLSWNDSGIAPDRLSAPWHAHISCF